MHRGCFVWTPTPLLSGRRTPRPGPARVCVCVPCLAGAGGPASRARSSATHLSFGHSWFVLCLFGPLRAGVALFVVVVGFFFFSLPPARCALVVSCFACLPAPAALGFGVLSPPPLFFCPPPLLSLAFPAFPLPGASAPPPFFFSFFLCCLFFLFPFFPFFFAGCAVRGGFVCLGPSGVPAFASVVLSLSLLCVRWLVLRGLCCWAWLSYAVSWWVLVSCFGGAVLVWPRGSPSTPLKRGEDTARATGASPAAAAAAAVGRVGAKYRAHANPNHDHTSSPKPFPPKPFPPGRTRHVRPPAPGARRRASRCRSCKGSATAGA